MFGSARVRHTREQDPCYSRRRLPQVGQAAREGPRLTPRNYARGAPQESPRQGSCVAATPSRSIHPVGGGWVARSCPFLGHPWASKIFFWTNLHVA